MKNNRNKINIFLITAANINNFGEDNLTKTGKVQDVQH